MLSEQQKRAAIAIINIFETSKVIGDYSLVVCAEGDAGGLTYGRSQTTINSGNLYLLIKAYVEADGAFFADDIRPYIGRVKDMDGTLCSDNTFKKLLRRAGREDDVMIETQDKFFDRVYWNPALNSARRADIKTALGVAVIYDSTVHGSWTRMRNRTNLRHGKVSEIGERDWISHYINVRREWLASFSGILSRTVYRMDAFKKIIDAENWKLSLPFSVRGLEISKDTLQISVSIPVGEPPRLLFLKTPYMTGVDVTELQQALISLGFNLVPGADGIFGPSTYAAVKAFQERNGLIVDGIVGPATRSALGIDDN